MISMAGPMRMASIVVRWVGYALSMLLCLILLIVLPAVNWIAARETLGEETRLRAYHVAKRRVAPGEQLAASDIELVVRHIRPDVKVLVARDIVGRYTARELKKGELLASHVVTARHLLDGAAAAALVQLEVDTRRAEALGPGMRVAFVRQEANEDEDDEEGEKEEREKAADKNQKPGVAVAPSERVYKLGFPDCSASGEFGYEIASISRSTDLDKPSLLRLRVQAEHSEDAAQLSVHRWTPVLIGAAPCPAQVSQAPADRNR